MLKDDKLVWLAERGCNVGQFVSYGPDLAQRHSVIREIQIGYTFSGIARSVATLLETGAPAVNIRTYKPDSLKGNPFPKGLTDPHVVEKMVRGFAAQGFYTIVNENINIFDGGFSGVLHGDLMEVAPGATPRCVEEFDKGECMCLPREVGFSLILTVYHFHFHSPFTKASRVEFSVHPHRVGYLRDFIVFWEENEPDRILPAAPKLSWPNRFSEAIGNKTYGLLMADLARMPVPFTMVTPRMIGQFAFGTPIHAGEPEWTRTSPRVHTPGKYPTIRGQADVYKLMHDWDPAGTEIPSVFKQHGIPAQYSGKASTDRAGNFVAEGCARHGDKYMVGTQAPEELPERVVRAVRFLYDRLADVFGDVQCEWVYDGVQAWCVQLTLGRTETLEDVIYPGRPKRWTKFVVQDNLANLYTLVDKVKGKNIGVTLIGDIGILSHFGELLSDAKIPSRLKRPKKK